MPIASATYLLTLDRELLARLRRQAKRQRKPMAQLIRETLATSLGAPELAEVNPPHRPRAAGSLS